MAEQTPAEYNGINQLAIEKLRGVPADDFTQKGENGEEWLHVKFQSGGTADNPRNGIFIEDLLITAYLKLSSYQDKFPCRENALALTKIEESLQWLTARKADREARGVYGKDEK